MLGVLRDPLDQWVLMIVSHLAEWADRQELNGDAHKDGRPESPERTTEERTTKPDLKHFETIDNS